MASGWFIDDIELPIAPSEDERVISRTFQSETLFQFFPELVKPSARAFDYTVVGFIWPEHKAVALDEIARSADTNTVIVKIPAAEKIFHTTKYAVKQLKMARKGPLFVNVLGQDRLVVPYSLTLTELPDDGEFQEGVDGFLEADEGGIGLGYLGQIIEETGSDLDPLDFGTIEAFQLALNTKFAN